MKKFSQRMLKVLLTLCMVAVQFNGLTFSIAAEETDEPIKYVSLGDSMTNGYGLEGYELNSGVETYGNASYANQFAKFLGENTDHAQLAMSGIRVEDLHWLLELDYNDQEAIDLIQELIDGDWDEEKWNAKFSTGDYWTLEEICNHSRLDATYLAIVGGTNYDDSSKSFPGKLDADFEYPTTFNNAADLSYKQNRAMKVALVAKYFQDHVTEADIVSLAVGNGNLGVFGFGRILDIIGFDGDGVVGTSDYRVESAIREMDPEMQASVLALKAKLYEVVKAEMGMDIEGNETLKSLADIVVYIGLSMALNYAGAIEAVLQLNPDAEIMMVALMNTFAEEGEVEGVSIGDLMNVCVKPMNAYLAALPTIMQAVNNGVYKDATFYYAEAPFVECMVNTYAGGLTPIVRDRFVESIVGDHGDGMIWNNLGDKVETVSLEQIEYFEEIPAENVLAWAADPANSKLAASCAMYLAFENAIIESVDTAVSLESIMGLGNLSNDFDSIMEVYAAKAATSPELAVVVDFLAAVGGLESADVLSLLGAANEVALEEAAYTILAKQASAKASDLMSTPENPVVVTIKVDQVKALLNDNQETKDAAIYALVASLSDGMLNAENVELLYTLKPGSVYDFTATIGNATLNPSLPLTAELVKNIYNDTEHEFHSEVKAVVEKLEDLISKIDLINAMIPTLKDGFDAMLAMPETAVSMVLLLNPSVLGNVVADSELGGLLALFGRCVIGNGIGAHPSEAGHNALAAAVINAYDTKLTVKDETIKNATIVFDELVKLIETYGPEALEEAYRYAEENGYIAKFEAAVEELKVKVENEIVRFQKEDIPVIKAELEALGKKLVNLKAELETLKAELIAKKAELAEQIEAGYEEAVEALEKAIAELEALIEQIEKQIAVVEAKIEELMASLAKIEAKIVELQEALVKLNETAEALYNAIANASTDALNKAVEAYEAAKAAVAAAIEAVNTVYTELGEEITAVVNLMKEIAQASSELNACVEEKLAAVKGMLEKLPEELNKTVNELIEKVSAEAQAAVDAAWALAEEKIAALNAELAAQIEALKNEANAAIEAATAELKAKIATLEAELAAKVAELEAKAEELGKAAVAELKAQIAALEAELNDLYAQLENAGNELVAEINAQIAALEAELKGLYEQLENCVEEKKAEIEAKIAEVEAKVAELKAQAEGIIAAAKAEVEAKIAEVKAQIEALNAAVEAKIAEVKAEINAEIERITNEIKAEIAQIEAQITAIIEGINAEVEAKIAEVKAQIEAQIKAVKDAVEKEIAQIKAAAEAQIKQIETEIKNTIVGILTGIQNDLNNAVVALGNMIEDAIAAEVAKLEAYVVSLGKMAEAFVEGEIQKLEDAFKAAYENATTDDLTLREENEYVAFGDGSAESESYVDLFAAEIEEEYSVTLDVTNLAKEGHTVESLTEVLMANAEAVAEAELITVGYGNSTFADAAMNRLYAALRTGEVEEYDWAALVGEEAAPYFVAEIEKIHAQLVEAGLDVEIPFPAMNKATLATAMTLAVEAFAYETVSYALSLPTAIGAIRAVNPNAVVIVVGMYNPFKGSVLTYEDTSIELGSYVDELIKVANAYGTGLCMLTDAATFVKAPNAKTDLSDKELEATEFIFSYFIDKTVDMTPNEAGHEYISNQLLKALDIEVYTKPIEGVDRIYGTSRYDTSFGIADTLKDVLGVDQFDSVIIAAGANYADALAGSYIAATKNAPILMYNAFADNTADLEEYIAENMKPNGTVYILGGTLAVAEVVETTLAQNYTVKRLYGTSRYDTNLAILNEAGVGNEDILVCKGYDYADSLSASAAGKPILLVGAELTDAQREFLSNLNGNNIYVLGGTLAVNEAVEAELKAYGSVKRLAGATRYETSVLIAEEFFDAPETLVLAYARNFPDGLCGGPLAYALGAPMILVDTILPTNDDKAIEYARENGITDGAVLGGSGLVSDESVREIFQMSAEDTIQ